VSIQDNQRISILTERFEVIRFVYGLSNDFNMTIEQLEILWNLCSATYDREVMMVFLANAAFDQLSSNDSSEGSDKISSSPSRPSHGTETHIAQTLTPAYSSEARDYAFQRFFCSSTLDWEKLGPDGYKSFQVLLRASTAPTRMSLVSNGPAIDTLWKICLETEHDSVATHAMNDLLNAYSTVSALKRQKSAPDAWKGNLNVAGSLEHPEASFAHRIYEVLQQVRVNLVTKVSSSVRPAERCVRILNAAVGQSSTIGSTNTHIRTGRNQTLPHSRVQQHNTQQHNQ